MTDKSKNDDVKGEGNYTATRNFDKSQESFVKANKEKLDKLGKDAARALDSDEGKDLRKAEEEAKSHSKDR